MNSIDRYATICLTVGLVVWLESLITIEWSYPYCLSQSDGPAYAAQGMPLPYWMWNGVSSLEHHFVPQVYVLNIVLLSISFFPVVRWIWERTLLRRPKWLQSLIGAFGALLLVSHVALTVLMVSDGYLRPTMTLSLEGYYHYTEFRPVRIGFYRSNAPACPPSHFWFPNGWQHN